MPEGSSDWKNLISTLLMLRASVQCKSGAGFLEGGGGSNFVDNVLLESTEEPKPYQQYHTRRDQ